MLDQLQALCAGHVAAVLTAAAPASESFVVASRADSLDELMQATALPLVATALPEAVVPVLLAPLEALMKRPRQVRVCGWCACGRCHLQEDLQVTLQGGLQAACALVCGSAACHAATLGWEEHLLHGT